MNRKQELAIKLERVREMLRREDFHAVVLQRRANFSWITCGGLSHVNQAQETGVGGVLITPERALLIANHIEHRRLIEEELDGLDFETAEFPWHDPEGRKREIEKVTAGRTIGDDTGGEGPEVSAQMTSLRAQLTPPELERYTTLGREAREQVEDTCRHVEPGITEHQAAAMMLEPLIRRGMRIPVYLVAADERIETRRHPIATDKPIRNRVMMVACVERHGLIVSLTRLVNFAPVSAELVDRHCAVCEVDATAISSTCVGRLVHEVLAQVIHEYQRQGFEEQWREHHQGGSCGYQPRDLIATPSSDAQVRENQAFAWNPSIRGTKSEDTMVVTQQGPRMLTEPGPRWPMVEIQRGGRTLRRADILSRG